VFSLWENSPQLQRFEASQYEPPGQKEMGMPNLPQNLCGKVSLHTQTSVWRSQYNINVAIKLSEAYTNKMRIIAKLKHKMF
jgi:hypothetical protein